MKLAHGAINKIVRVNGKPMLTYPSLLAPTIPNRVLVLASTDDNFKNLAVHPKYGTFHWFARQGKMASNSRILGDNLEWYASGRMTGDELLRVFKCASYLPIGNRTNSEVRKITEADFEIFPRQTKEERESQKYKSFQDDPSFLDTKNFTDAEWKEKWEEELRKRRERKENAEAEAEAKRKEEIKRHYEINGYPTHEYVYFFQDIYDGEIKIGKTTTHRIKRRIREIEGEKEAITERKCEAIPIGGIEGYTEKESELHDRFDSHRRIHRHARNQKCHIREWFSESILGDCLGIIIDWCLTNRERISARAEICKLISFGIAGCYLRGEVVHMGKLYRRQLGSWDNPEKTPQLVELAIPKDHPTNHFVIHDSDIKSFIAEVACSSLTRQRPIRSL